MYIKGLGLLVPATLCGSRWNLMTYHAEMLDRQYKYIVMCRLYRRIFTFPWFSYYPRYQQFRIWWWVTHLLGKRNVQVAEVLASISPILCQYFPTFYVSIFPHFMPVFLHILCQYFPTFFASISPHFMPVFLHILCQYFPTFYANISPLLCQYFPTFYASISPHIMPVFPHISASISPHLCQYFPTFLPVFPHILCHYITTFYPHLYYVSVAVIFCVVFRRTKFAASSKDFDKYGLSRMLVVRQCAQTCRGYGKGRRYRV